MKFTYDLDHDTLTLKAYKSDVEIWFNKGEVECVTFGGNTLNSSDDCLDGIAVYVYDQWCSLRKVITEAERVYDELASDAEDEAEYEAQMQREWSSPYWTGRI